MYPHLGIPSCPSRSVPPHASEVTRILRSVGISWLNLFLTLAQLESDHRYSVVSGVFGLAYPGGSSLSSDAREPVPFVAVQHCLV